MFIPHLSANYRFNPDWRQYGPEPESETLPVPVIGVRIMRVSKNSPHLESAYWSVIWETAEMDAICQPGGAGSFAVMPEDRHTAPDWDCNCGLFAFASYSALQSNMIYRTVFDTADKVAAAVVCSGKLIVHGPEGFRCQRQRIVALSNSRLEDNLDLSELLVKYDVVQLPYEELIPYASKFGKTLA
jgi:hypothetical protein